MDDSDGLRLAAVAQNHFPTGRARGVDQAFHLRSRVHIGVHTVAVIRNLAGIKGLVSRRQNDGPHLDRFQFGLLLQVHGVAVAAGLNASLLAAAALEVNAGFGVDDRYLRYGLREGNVNGLAFAQTQVEFIGYFRLLVDAPLDAFQAADAKVLIDVARVARDGDLKVPHVPLHLGHLGKRPKGDVGVLLHRRHLGRKDARGAIEGGEGLIEFRHVPADGGFALDQVNVLAGVGKRQGRMDSRNAAAHNQHAGVDGHALLHQGFVQGHAPDRRAQQGHRLSPSPSGGPDAPRNRAREC